MAAVEEGFFSSASPRSRVTTLMRITAPVGGHDTVLGTVDRVTGGEGTADAWVKTSLYVLVAVRTSPSGPTFHTPPERLIQGGCLCSPRGPRPSISCAGSSSDPPERRLFQQGRPIQVDQVRHIATPARGAANRSNSRSSAQHVSLSQQPDRCGAANGKLHRTDYKIDGCRLLESVQDNPIVFRILATLTVRRGRTKRCPRLCGMPARPRIQYPVSA